MLNKHFKNDNKIQCINDIYTVYESYKPYFSIKKDLENIIIHWYTPMYNEPHIYFKFDDDLDNVIEWFDTFYPEIVKFTKRCDEVNESLSNEYIKVSKSWFNE